jgi:hypothetical protein
MRLARFFRRLALIAVPALLGLGALGCNTYKYYDVHVTFDPAGAPGFTKASAFSVFVCQVTVSGAESTQFDLPHGSSDQRCPNMIPGMDPLDAGSFEFTTFADSGNLTFTLDAFQDMTRTAPCHIGHGALTLPVNSTITTPGELKIQNTGMSCVTTGNTPGDGGAIVLD